MTEEMKARIKPMLEAGIRRQEIARLVKLGASTIYKYRTELLAEGAGAAVAGSTD
jgi:hypothetical protein